MPGLNNRLLALLASLNLVFFIQMVRRGTGAVLLSAWPGFPINIYDWAVESGQMPEERGVLSKESR